MTVGVLTSDGNGGLAPDRSTAKHGRLMGVLVRNKNTPRGNHSNS